MSGRRQVLIFLLLAVAIGSIFPLWPSKAQLPGQPEDEGQSEAILRVAVAEVRVQGEQAPEAIKEALPAVLPALAACLQSEYQRLGKLPAKITLRFNLSGNGKVVWTKLIDPPQKSLDICLGKAMSALRLPPAGNDLSRVTVVLECHFDHLLAP